jgi:muconate cycloisomerase
MRLEVMAVDLPFHRRFRHAAAARNSSESLFVKCVTDAATVGFGESLPREYVTDETRDDAFVRLETMIFPHLVGQQFESMDELYEFLWLCDGKAPAAWISADTPQLAAWCAVDLALLDAFGHAFREPVRVGTARDAGSHGPTKDSSIRYGAVVSADAAWRFRWSLLKLRLYGIKDVKLKVDGDPLPWARVARKILGPDANLRIDANMAWDANQALHHLRALKPLGIDCVEQPLEANNLEDGAWLVRESEAEVIADEGFTDAASLRALVDWCACCGVSVRISKCGGLVAAARRCEEARHAGLILQVGCQVGESSLLSAAQRILLTGIEPPKYLEGCYGRHLLGEDPVSPVLQVGYAGRPPQLPGGPGLGVKVDEAKLKRCVSRHALVERAPRRSERKESCRL